MEIPNQVDFPSAMQRSPWLILLAGLAFMYLPVYWWAASTIWQTDDQAHGAIILGVALWLFWQCRGAVASAEYCPAPLLGWPIFALGLVAYVIGRALDISIFELGSQVLVLAGSLLVIQGVGAIRQAWFPILYLIFMVPLPGLVVDAVTAPLKNWISVIVENTLYAAGYPVARNGVVLSVGQYQLLVADACSGLHSMFSLTALGILFMYLMARKSWVHNGLMLASILPIAFAANVVRVMVLVLVTYHFGDEAGQGFLHGAAGIVLMLAALLFLVMLDSLLGHVTGFQAKTSISGR